MASARKPGLPGPRQLVGDMVNATDVGEGNRRKVPVVALSGVPVAFGFAPGRSRARLGGA